MRIDYEPNGVSGYTCQLIGGGAVVTVRGTNGATEIEVASEGLPTQAAVAAVERYTSHEYERRRTRDPEKREHHAKEASKWREAAEDIAPLLGDLTDDTENGWCSDCMTKSDHRIAGSKTKFRTRQYVCTACGSPTGWCDVPRCRNFADRGGGPYEAARFCAEHDHEIPSFEKLGAQVASLDEYVPWLEFERFNAGSSPRSRRRRSPVSPSSVPWPSSPRQRSAARSVFTRACLVRPPRAMDSRFSEAELLRRAATGWRGESQW